MSEVAFNKLFPEAREVEIRSRASETPDRFIIRPFTVGQLPRVLKAIRALIEAGGVDTEGNLNVFDALTNGAEHAVELMAVATGKDRSYFDNLDVDAGIDLMTAIIEVNKDFFTQRVQPKLAERLKGIGLTR